MPDHDVRFQLLQSWLEESLPVLFEQQGWGKVPAGTLTPASSDARVDMSNRSGTTACGICRASRALRSCSMPVPHGSTQVMPRALSALPSSIQWFSAHSLCSALVACRSTA